MSSRYEKWSYLLIILSKSEYKAWHLSQYDNMKLKKIIIFINGRYNKPAKKIAILPPLSL